MKDLSKEKLIVMLSSSNPSKVRSLNEALKQLGIENFKIFNFKVDSGVPNQPIGFEILRGCENRNSALKNIAKDENIKYDYLVSVEGGFSLDENGLPFVVTYALIENKFGQKSTGKSLGIRLNREMYKYIREGNSLNSLIENIENSTDNKKFKGIMGYLSNGIYKRDRVDTDSLISAFIPLLNRDRYDTLTQNIRENKKV